MNYMCSCLNKAERDRRWRHSACSGRREAARRLVYAECDNTVGILIAYEEQSTGWIDLEITWRLSTCRRDL